jgi:hypothetical protein
VRHFVRLKGLAYAGLKLLLASADPRRVVFFSNLRELMSEKDRNLF